MNPLDISGSVVIRRASSIEPSAPQTMRPAQIISTVVFIVLAFLSVLFCIDLGGELVRVCDKGYIALDAVAPVLAPVFLNLTQASKLLGVSERTFHELRRRGLVPEPIKLGERALRWERSALVEHVSRHAPRGGMLEPEHLARARELAANRSATGGGSA